MSLTYTISWLATNQVILIALKDNVDVDAVSALTDELHTMLDASNRTSIYIIVDDRQTTGLPTLGEVNRLRSSLRHPKISWIISVGNNINPVVKFISAVAVRVANLPFKQVDNFEEAITSLNEIDPSIEWQTLQH